MRIVCKPQFCIIIIFIAGDILLTRSPGRLSAVRERVRVVCAAFIVSAGRRWTLAVRFGLIRKCATDGRRRTDRIAK